MHAYLALLFFPLPFPRKKGLPKATEKIEEEWDCLLSGLAAKLRLQQT